MIFAPIVLFVYNRPDHTESCLKAIMDAELSSESTLYIFSDGPKDINDSLELEKIKLVRKIITKENWCLNVKIIESESNKGLAASIIDGVSMVIGEFGKVIVLEDDIIVSKGFLKYCNKALELYEKDDEVMHVSASMFNANFTASTNTFFLKVLSCHGWATWKRAWDKLNLDALDHLTYFQSDFKRSYDFDVEGSSYFLEQLRRNVSGQLKTWAVLWYASWLRAGGLSIFPVNSLLINEGFDGSGVNCGVTNSYLNPAVDYIEIDKIEISENLDIRNSVAKFWVSYLTEKKNENKKSRYYFFNKNLLLDFVKRIVRSVFYKFFPELGSFSHENEFSLINVKRDILYSKLDISSQISNPVLMRYCQIGAFTYIAPSSLISYCSIGKFCSIGPNLNCGWGIHPTNGISTSPSFYSVKSSNNISFSKESKIIERKPVRIGNDVFIGMNVTILDGVTIGNGAIIGAGCVVVKDVPPYAIVGGNPMKIIRFRFEPEVIAKLELIKWWDFDEESMKKVEENFFNVEIFLDSEFK